VSYEFGGFRLDPRRRLLLGADEAPIEIPSRAFDLLIYLVEHPGDVLEKSTLLKAVWPTTVVEESNLSQAIFLLRRALGDTAAEHHFIATVPGRGYQFVAAVGKNDGAGAMTPSEIASTSAPRLTKTFPSAQDRARWLWTSGLVLILAAAGFTWWLRAPVRPASTGPANATVAVLPFTDLTPAKDMEYLADGLADEITGQLAKLPDLRVIGRRSAFTFKNTNEDVRTIGQRLRVKTVLEGSVRKESGRLRISTQLTQARDGVSLWSESYDRDFDDLLGLQSTIAREVAAALTPIVGNKVAPHEAPLTRSPEAYAAYLRGQFIYRKQINAEFGAACDEFKRATVFDPQFALAFAQLGRCYEMMAYRTQGNTAQLHSLGSAAVDRALQLDPSIADVWWMAWFSERGNSPFLARVNRLQRTLAMNPNDTEVMLSLAWTYLRLGRTEAAVRLLERAYQVDPLWTAVISALAQQHYDERGDRAELLRLADELERISPNDPGASQLRARAAFTEGRALDWDRVIARAVAIAPRDLPVNGYLSIDYAQLGIYDAALHHAKVTRLANPQNAAGWYNLTYLQLASGNLAAARSIVEEAMRLHPDDFLARRARAELLYFEHDCAGSIDSSIQAEPLLAQPFSSLDVIQDAENVPMLAWCLRQQGNIARADEIGRAFELQFPKRYFGAAWNGLRARMAAAMGDRRELLTSLRAIDASRSMVFAFFPHEPMIQPWLADPEVKALLGSLAARRAEWRRILPKSSMRVPVPGLSPKDLGS
jgi:TolB-like protein/DNA-binding winged helix-turn-helix (wHTH) protein/cytochrome c-type biogenesis protein CcmH/NrfG